MQTQMIYADQAKTIEEAREIAPWATEIIEVEGGYKAFESAADAETWKAQA